MTADSRRTFVKKSLLAGLGMGTVPGLTRAIDPIRRNGVPHFRLSIAAYSYRKYLDLGIKPKPPMDLFAFADIAAQMGLDAIEPTAYYFADTSHDFMGKLKGYCTKLGLDISGTAVGNDFCDAKRLTAQIAHVKDWIEKASRLGAKTIRIFAGSTPKGETEETARRRCVAAIQEACDHAGKYGIFLALENHGGITSTAEQLLAIVRAVNHDWFGVNLDTGNFHTADPYADLGQLAPFAVTVQIKTEIQRRGMKKELADLRKLIGILREVNYRGYLALEYEAAEEPKTAIPGHVAELKRLL